MSRQLSQSLIKYVQDGMDGLAKTGVQFGSTNEAYGNIARTSRSAGLGEVRSRMVGDAGQLRIVTIFVTDVPVVALASGQWMTFEPRESWSDDGKVCLYEVGLSPFHSIANKFQNYDCQSFIDGKEKARFNRAFEAEVRHLLQTK